MQRRQMTRAEATAPEAAHASRLHAACHDDLMQEKARADAAEARERNLREGLTVLVADAKERVALLGDSGAEAEMVEVFTQTAFAEAINLLLAGGRPAAPVDRASQ